MKQHNPYNPHNPESAENRQRKFERGEPHGWVQWKGTDVCMDFHCRCGYFGHVDGMFAYFIECPECHTVYMSNAHIEMVPLTAQETAYVQKDERPIVKPD